jgi:hypothetical protein
LFDNLKNDKLFQGGEQTSENSNETEDPNVVPEGGVNANIKGQHTGSLVRSVDDLYNFMKENPGLIDLNTFAEFMHMAHRLKTEGIDFYFDMENEGRLYNEETGKWGYVYGSKDRD